MLMDTLGVLVFLIPKDLRASHGWWVRVTVSVSWIVMYREN